MTDYNIKLGSQSDFKVTVQTGGLGVPARFTDLIDFDGDETYDQYVLMYNASNGKWTARNPDEVLRSAAERETRQPGLVGYADEFLNRLDIDLDDRINVDGGGF